MGKVVIKTGYTGISFPFRFGPGGGVVTSSTSDYNIDHIREAVQQIVGTRAGSSLFPGERYILRNYGSNVPAVLFEPLDTSNLEVIRGIVQIALAKWEPRVEVQRAEFLEINQEEGRVILELDLFVKKNQTVITVEVPL